MTHSLFRIAIITLFLTSVCAAAEQAERTIAVTFDDVPAVNVLQTDLAGRRDMTLRLLSSIASRRIPVVGFVNERQLYEGDQLQDERVDLLRLWIAAGLELGNHTYSHPDLHRVSLEAFQEDVIRGEPVTRELLASRDRALRYFRHPYLHTGRDLATKVALEDFLAARGYRIAPVSIDNSEWIFARAYLLALRGGDDALAVRIGSDYVDYMIGMLRYYEAQSQALFERNIAHVLLVHANELNADWFGELADRIADAGYEFVDLDTALEDPAYDSEDTYTGPGGITWLHRWGITRDVDRSIFRGEPATPEYVLELTELPEHSY